MFDKSDTRQRRGVIRKGISLLFKRGSNPPSSQQSIVPVGVQQGQGQSRVSSMSTNPEVILNTSASAQNSLNQVSTLDVVLASNLGLSSNATLSSEVPDGRSVGRNASLASSGLSTQESTRLPAERTSERVRLTSSEPNLICSTAPSVPPHQGLAADSSRPSEAAPATSDDLNPSARGATQTPQKTLWNQACDSLSPEEKAFIEGLTVEKSSINPTGECKL